MKVRQVNQKRPIIEKDDEVRLPVVEYKTVAAVSQDKVFEGRTTPIPTALFEYLTGSEIKVFSIILRHHREFGCCLVKTTAMAKAIGVTHISIANIIAKLRKMGIVHYEVAGKKRNKVIDWDTIEVLDKMSARWRSGGLTALRKKVREKDIIRILPDNYRDIRTRYEINNDPVENEEYD